MNYKEKLRKITIGAMLTALAIIIPIQFSFLRIWIPPFSATLASHVPMFISMFISPGVALMVGLGSTIGFFLTAPAVVAARAASHIAAGFLGALLIKNGKSMFTAFSLTLPVHAIIEVLVVIPFGYTAYNAIVVVGIGTAIHHTMDACIAASVIYAIKPIMSFAKR
jgi:niacin transporter